MVFQALPDIFPLFIEYFSDLESQTSNMKWNG